MQLVDLSKFLLFRIFKEGCMGNHFTTFDHIALYCLEWTLEKFFTVLHDYYYFYRGIFKKLHTSTFQLKGV